ncbi:MAG: hypothetical protein BWK79_08095 [Beggiatoa sp. IS2]|nr:MAG: hypothetical protein BWK79_08095 [Beggiatoa sp. IS2]
MRSLALLLLLANIGFFSWQLSWLPWLPWQPSQFGPSLSPATPPASHLPRLILVSEQDAAKSIISSSSTKTNHLAEKPKNGVKTAMPSTVETANSKMVNVKGESVASVTENSVLKTAEKVSIAPIDPILTQESVLEADSAHLDNGIPSNSQQIVESVASLNTPTELTPLASTAAAVVLVPDKTTVVASDKRPTTDKPDKAVPHEKKEIATKPPDMKVTKAEKSPSAKMMCLRIGPYKEVDTAKNAAAWLNQKHTGSAKIQNRDDDKEVLHTRVYLPFANKTAAQQAQQRLVQLGIKEYTLLPDNTISLGVYRDPVNAEQRLAGLKDKGFTNVKMEKQYKNGTQHWLSVKIPVDQNEWLNGFKKNFKGATVETVACEKLP